MGIKCHRMLTTRKTHCLAFHVDHFLCLFCVFFLDIKNRFIHFPRVAYSQSPYISFVIVKVFMWSLHDVVAPTTINLIYSQLKNKKKNKNPVNIRLIKMFVYLHSFKNCEKCDFPRKFNEINSSFSNIKFKAIDLCYSKVW